MPPFRPGYCHQPGPKLSFQQPKWREAGIFGPSWWHQPGPMPPFSPGWCHQPGPKASFQQPKGRETKAFGTGWCHEPVPMPPFSSGWCHHPVQTALCYPRRVQKFSPTSLVERARKWFISADAPTLSSSSQMQAYGPKRTICACGPIEPIAGLNPGPIGFLVVFRSWWPNRWQIFYFFPVFCFLFFFLYFVLFYFILFCFVYNYLFILFYDNSFYY